jgi:hypothetical protein
MEKTIMEDVRLTKQSKTWMQKWLKDLEEDFSKYFTFVVDEKSEPKELTLSGEDLQELQKFLEAQDNAPPESGAVDVVVKGDSELWKWGLSHSLLRDVARKRYCKFIDRYRTHPAIRKLRKNRTLTLNDQDKLEAMWREVEPQWPREIACNGVLRELFGCTVRV